MDFAHQYPFSEAEWETCMKVLTALKDKPFENPDNQRFKTLVTSIYKKAKKQTHDLKFEAIRQHDAQLLGQVTTIQQIKANASIYTHQEAQQQGFAELGQARFCYICHAQYKHLHFFYHKLCPDCAVLNYRFRQIEPDFKRYQVIITGGRVKTGYATALKFLRSGANVLITTRFPATAWEQLRSELDFEVWKDKITVYGLDLRNIKSVYQFIDYCNANLNSLEILVNNAAQTIKYPVKYYQPLIAQEEANLILHAHANLIENLTPIALNTPPLLAATESIAFDMPLNRFGQPIDERDKNSWNATLEEIGLEELIEVNLINHISPYILIGNLGKLMEKSLQKYRFIINVTSSEGQFSYANKTIFHPHTNMTKAALNMLTRTAAADYKRKNIYMNAVDVGWISTGVSEIKRKKLFGEMRVPPLDPVDGAMRILHPIMEIQQGNTELYGKLLKNYQLKEW